MSQANNSAEGRIRNWPLSGTRWWSALQGKLRVSRLTVAGVRAAAVRKLLIS